MIYSTSGIETCSSIWNKVTFNKFPKIIHPFLINQLPIFLSRQISYSNWVRPFSVVPCLGSPYKMNSNPYLFIQKRYFDKSIQRTVEKDLFFNRKNEISAFTQIFQGVPQLSLITGPVDSGKTALLLHILKDLSETENRPILHLDLRGRSFVTVNEFAATLENEFEGWFKKFKDIALSIPTPVGSIDLKANTTVRSPIERFNGIFETLSKELPENSFWKGKLRPILFIDEANKLKLLLKDKDGDAALSTLFEWFVKNTKQEQRFHVILASSDSFFHLWVSRRIGASRFESYTVGNLPKHEAERFWNENIVSSSNQSLLPKFEDAFKACGGNILYLRKYFTDYKISEGKLTPQTFFLVSAERHVLMRNLWKGTISDNETNSPNWSRKQYIDMMKKLVQSKEHFIIYDDLCTDMGESVVDALIDSNILHLRPSNGFFYDIVNYPVGKAIVTAETPASLLAMKEIIYEIENGILNPHKSIVVSAIGQDLSQIPLQKKTATEEANPLSIHSIKDRLLKIFKKLF